MGSSPGATGLRAAVRRALGLDKLHDRIESLEAKVREVEGVVAVLDPSGKYIDTSKKRWRNVAPNRALTWGKEFTGDAFVQRAQAHGVFGPTKTIVELGPGYGRLLKSILAGQVPFRRYYGVDISPKNVEHLRGTLGREEIQFVNADVEQCELPERFDAFVSSLTMKHLFPTFECALNNLTLNANPGARFAFDLIEGTEPAHFERDNVTYVKAYTRDEIESILGRVGLRLLAFDEVQHLPDYKRLLVVAQK